ncbi:MAG: hypothetical protein OHK0031_13920 [Anaerolineales bacterium]
MQKITQNDDFGSFLSTVQRAVNQPQGGDASMRIIQSLSRNKQAKMTQMVSLVKTSWSTFNESLQYLQDAGLVRMEDDDEGGTLWLTEEGEHWARTMNLEWNDSDDAPAAEGGR